MSEDAKITVILPEASRDLLSEGLRDLTRRIAETGAAETNPGLLGGEWGYGCDYENDVFQMHHFCWCERDDCPWCNEPYAPNFWHKPSGLKVHWYKWIGRGMEVEGSGDILAILAECASSLGASA